MFKLVTKAIQLLIGFFTVIILDIIWFSLVGDIYDSALLPMQADFNTDLTTDLLGASIVVYFLIACAIVFFVLPKLTPDTDYTQSFFWGGFLGLIIYGIFDLTNYIFLNQWPFRIAVMDICWGFVLFGIATIVIRSVTSLINKIMRSFSR